jgi:hypothetical protein
MKEQPQRRVFEDEECQGGQAVSYMPSSYTHRVLNKLYTKKVVAQRLCQAANCASTPHHLQPPKCSTGVESYTNFVSTTPICARLAPNPALGHETAEARASTCADELIGKLSPAWSRPTDRWQHSARRTRASPPQPDTKTLVNSNLFDSIQSSATQFSANWSCVSQIWPWVGVV